jgi:phage head maturation protease
MEHLLLKAATTATDEGVFEAVISTATIDRELDIVEPQAMVDALQKWVPTGKKVPLRWNHGTKPEHVIGHIDPASARVVDGEVVVDGWIDQKAKLGSEGWRLVKSGVLGFSFGYLITAGEQRKGGGRHITGMDVFEVTATHAPMNGETRVLGWKSAEDLRDEAKRVEREVEEQKIPEVPEPPEAPVEPEIDLVQELQEVKAQLAEMRAGLEDLTKKAEVTAKEPSARAVDPLRKQADAVALEVASGDKSLLNPPKVVAPKRPEPSLTLKELKQRTRDEMLGVLSGGTI